MSRQSPAPPRVNGVSGSRPSDGNSPLRERVAGEARALLRQSRLANVAVALAVAVCVLAAGALLLGDGRWLVWPRGVPLLVWLATGIGAALAVRAVARRVPAPLGVEGVAHGIERERGLRAGSLRSAMEISDGGALGARAAADVERVLGPDAVLLPAGRQQRARTLWAGAGAVVVAFGLLAGSAALARDGFAAVANPIDAWRGLLLPALRFEQVPEEMPRGMPLAVQVHAEGRSQLLIAVRAEGDAWREVEVAVDPVTNLAVLDVGPVRAPITVRVNDGRAPILERTVRVGDRGWIGDVRIDAEYPAYLARPSETLEPGGVLRVPRGTSLRVQAVAYSGARDVRLVSDTDSSGFTAVGTSGVVTQFTVDRDGEWRWAAEPTPRPDGQRLPVELPPVVAVSVIADEVPEVAILAPITDTTIGTAGSARLIIGARDDHGLAAISLTVQRELPDGTRGAEERVVLSSELVPAWDGLYDLRLNDRGLEAGDRLLIAAHTTDGSPWRQRASSRTLVLRVPTAEEQRIMARSLADSLMDRAAALAAAERALERSTSNASRSRELQSNTRDQSNSSSNSSSSPGENKSSMSFESAEKMRSLAQQQRDLGSRVEDLKEGAKELEQRLSDAGALDQELSSRFQDLQRMLREAMTPEMQEQLQQLEQSADRMSGNEVRQSLEQLAEQQKQMQQQLEKSAEMLKRAALEGAMETLRDEARELADAERRMADALSELEQAASGEPGTGKGEQAAAGERAAGEPQPDTRTAEERQRDAKRMADRSRKLQDEVEALTDRLRKEGAQAGAEKTQAAQPDVETARKAMEQAADQLAELEKAAREAGAQQPGEQQAGQPQPGQQQAGQQQAGEQQAGQQAGQKQGQQGAAKPGQQGQQQAGQQQARQQQAGQQQAGQQQAGQQQAGQQPGQAGQQPQPGQQAGRQGQQGQQPGDPQSASQQAQRAADAMDRAADQLAAARDAQVDAWKEDLSEQLDQAINETAQLARQQQELADRAQREGDSQSMQSEQGALQKGVQQAAERMEQAGRGSALLSQRSQKAMAEAQQRSQQATQSLGNAGQPGGGEQAQSAMNDAAQALNQALSSLVRDRERVNNANSASGFGEMLEQMQKLAQQQGSLNGQMQGLSLLPGGPQGQQAQQQARVLARQQRSVASDLQDVADIDPTGRLEALAREASQVAAALDRGGPDPATAARQQQLYRRMLDAGRFMQQEERDEQGAREARAGDGRGTTRATGPSSGREGVRFAPPTWNDLRGLSADERRLVYEYFRRLNTPTP